MERTDSLASATTPVNLQNRPAMACLVTLLRKNGGQPGIVSHIIFRDFRNEEHSGSGIDSLGAKSELDQMPFAVLVRDMHAPRLMIFILGITPAARIPIRIVNVSAVRTKFGFAFIIVCAGIRGEMFRRFHNLLAKMHGGKIGLCLFGLFGFLRISFPSQPGEENNPSDQCEQNLPPRHSTIDRMAAGWTSFGLLTDWTATRPTRFKVLAHGATLRASSGFATIV
jgi:hypothetical protein